jgi:Protein of unknown function (DUF3616)
MLMAKGGDKHGPTLVLPDSTVVPGVGWRVKGDLGEHRDLSGIACLPDGRGLIVTDEGSFTQPVVLDRNDRRLSVAGDAVALLRPGEEADLEGLCSDGERFYATGSHALGRKVPDHQPSRHHVYRMRLKGDGKGLKCVVSHALEPLLENDALVARHYLKRLNAAERGLDIEGIAVRDGRMLLGLRSPALAGQAFVLSVATTTLFGDAPSRQQSVERFALPLGEGAGIRDLAAVDDGVLILSGPSTDEDEAPFALWLWRDDQKLVRLGAFGDLGKAKAEGLLVLATKDGSYDLLVLFDGVEQGSPHEFRVPRPH